MKTLLSMFMFFWQWRDGRKRSAAAVIGAIGLGGGAMHWHDPQYMIIRRPFSKSQQAYDRALSQRVELWNAWAKEHCPCMPPDLMDTVEREQLKHDEHKGGEGVSKE